MKNVLNEVQARMASLKSQKAAELDLIASKQKEAQEAAETAEAALTRATEELDSIKFEAASRALQSAQAALDMCERRHEQVLRREMISEADSDAVIDELLAYEDQLASDFHKAIMVPLRQLEKLCADHRAQAKECMETIDEWTRDVHANHRSFSGSLYRDAGGNLTSRSNTPVPVHVIPYVGCNEAVQIKTFLEKIFLLLNVNGSGEA